MPYYVQRSGQTWQLIWSEWQKPKRNVPKKSEEARRLGFRPEMSYVEAKARAGQIHAEDWIAREAKTAAKRNVQLKLRSAFLTDDDAADFWQRYSDEHKLRLPIWNTMQKIIVGVGIHPSDWFERKSALYAQFVKHRCSANYAKKLLRYLNLWGYFLCKKQGRAFLKVPGLEGTWKNKLEVARKPGGASKPLTPEILESRREHMSDDHYRWLFLSVWFGLRPEEVDCLRTKNAERWRIAADIEHGYVLSVFQKKLFDRGVPSENCWKHLPTAFPQQKLGIEFIMSGQFTRPIGEGGKFMRNHFGTGFSLYAGRNNFSGMLRDAGYDLETRKHWLGHLSIKTTEAYDRKTMAGRAFFRAPSKKAG
jgi:hypothetical protein